MSKICYVERAFRPATLATIEQANEIIEDFEAQGYDLTLRQLYYQFVAADLIANKQTEYDRLGSIVNDARLAGLIDWSAIVDRTRSLKALAHWASVGELLAEDAECYREDKWAEQRTRLEVWIEKEALAGVFQRVCQELDVPWFACRGYVSQSEMWRAANRFLRHESQGYDTVILHFGDHDPSGIDMTRDIQDRLHLFGSAVEVRRLALNMDQVEEHGPPPNFAKLTDARAKGYVAEYGESSWELDALNPQILSGLVRDAVGALRDDEEWRIAKEHEELGRRTLTNLSEEHS